jgi:hypothetical protein
LGVSAAKPPGEYERQARQFGKKNSEKLLALLRAHDPLFETTWRMLEHMLDILPDTAEFLVKKGTHDDPAMFLELYKEMREWAREVEHRKHRRGQANRQAQGRAKAEPAREAAGDREAKRRTDLDALVAKVKSGRAEEGDLLRYIELSMAGGADDGGNAGGR